MSTKEGNVNIAPETKRANIVQRRKILSGLDDESLIGLTVSVLWKHETLQAEVILCGSKGDMRALEDAKVSEADQLSFLNCTDSTGQGFLPENSGTLEDSEALNLDRYVRGINNPEISGIIHDTTPTIDPAAAFDKDVIIKSLETKLANLEKRHRELKKFGFKQHRYQQAEKYWIRITKTTRPALDHKKLMAVKNYTIKMCNLHPRTFEMAEFDRRIKNV
ncbi:unnamed protein product [Allacma fusca]|uniref:Uncharacterized protein n=1 Tax=Allacma fusca TaxID=39272 RepID=A0A8J2KBF2_9HEXA|nr:unnamed protein product [Allacma fusca]